MVTHKIKNRILIFLITNIFICILLSSCNHNNSSKDSLSTTQTALLDEDETTTTEPPSCEFSSSETTSSDILTPEASTSETSTHELSTSETSLSEISTSDTSISDADYIYYQIRNDHDSVVALGDVSATHEELSKLTEVVKSYDKDISFKAVSVDGTGCLSYNSDKQYFAASSIKAPYLLYCYMQLDQGNGTLHEEMIYNSSFYKDGSGDIKNSSDGTVYTLQEIMRRVMWNSDNSGYYMCINRWGTSEYNKFIEAIGCENLKISPNNIWVDNIRAEDLAIAWKHIYDYFESDAAHADVFYDSCIDYKHDFLGRGIPGYTIAQKYGISSTKNVYCDGAIVYGDNCTYILSIFTSSKGDTSDKAFIADVVSKINAIMDK